jgi:prepilin-type N-terminal cleavage/methylation domain-containing protein
MKVRGFTIVELIIVITIMGILLTLAVVNVNSSQTNARDTERKDDVSALAANLEAFYRAGNGTTSGRYPSLVIAGNETTLSSTLKDLDLKAATAPNATNATASFIAATNDIQTTTGVLPQPSVSQYVYQPLQVASGTTNWTRCLNETQECRKFNIFYRLEGDNTVYVTTSLNQ